MTRDPGSPDEPRPERDDAPNGPTGHRGGESYQTCPECGLPTTMADTVCGFCGGRLTGAPTASGHDWRASYEQAKWRYKMVSPKNSPAALFRRIQENILGMIIGAGLAGLGLWLMVSGFSSDTLLEGLIGLLFVIYGGYAFLHAVGAVKKK